MDLEKIAKIVSEVKSKKELLKEETKVSVDPMRETAKRISKIILDIQKSLENLED